MYVFDTNIFLHLFNFYYRSQFPSLWEKFDEIIGSGKVSSVREVYNEITNGDIDDFFKNWLKNNRDIFTQPTNKEIEFVKEIYKVKHFRDYNVGKEQLKGSPVADPFVVAKAHVNNELVVTQESDLPNAARIPNICKKFKVKCMSLEGFMKKENWIF